MEDRKSRRRRQESGEVGAARDIATMEKVRDRFVSRIIREDLTASSLSPDVFERLPFWRVAPSVTVNELARAASLPWAKQVGRVFWSEEDLLFSQ